MKKILYILTVMLILVGILAACAETPLPEETTLIPESPPQQTNTLDETEDLSLEINPIIAQAIETGYRVIWNFWSYTGFWGLDDCQSYLILFLSRSIGLTAYGSIEHYIVEEESGLPLLIRFYVQLTGGTDSETLIFYVNSRNLHIYDRDGNLLNPNGWPWDEPERRLSSDEIEEILWSTADAAGWFERYPDGDKMINELFYYCFKTYTLPDSDSSGARHTGYSWINPITGEQEIERFSDNRH